MYLKTNSMIKLFHIGLMVLLLMVVGCGRKVTPSTSTIVKDSIYVKEVPRYVEVKIPGDTVTITEVIECDSVTNKPKAFERKEKSGRATLKVELTDQGQLTATSECDSLLEVIKVLDKEIFHLKHESKKETIVVTEYKTRWFDIAARWIAGIVMLATVGFVVFKIWKPF